MIDHNKGYFYSRANRTRPVAKLVKIDDISIFVTWYNHNYKLDYLKLKYFTKRLSGYAQEVFICQEI
ncbi:MAG: hypothetical protein KAF91_13010 [Nostoc sp. TH1S01]|nr:hypothetical protein [Nostoc sp. TH1S01]